MPAKKTTKKAPAKKAQAKTVRVKLSDISDTLYGDLDFTIVKHVKSDPSTKQALVKQYGDYYVDMLLGAQEGLSICVTDI